MSSTEQSHCLIPMDKAIDYLPFVTLAEAEITAIRQGRQVDYADDLKETNCVRIYSEQKQFIGIGEYLGQGIIKAKRLMSF
jgi:tRNA pseudouridine55 synthase